MHDYKDVRSLPVVALVQTARYMLASAAGVRPHNVVVEPAILQGKKEPKVVVAQVSAAPGTHVETFALIDDLEFSDNSKFRANGRACTCMKQPTLIASDIKSGMNDKGEIALWIDVGTVAHFRNRTAARK